MTTPRSLLTFILGLCTALLMAGCSAPADEDRYAIAVGADLDFAGLELRSVFIVTAAENQPGRLLGTIFNTTSTNIDLVIKDSDEEQPLSIPAGGKLELQDTSVVLDTTGARPGARTDLTLQAQAESARFDVVVLDGTLEQYAPYVPKP